MDISTEQITAWKEENRLLKLAIYKSCHNEPHKRCIGEECPLHDVMEMCETKYRLGKL